MTAVTSARNAEMVSSLGAERVIDYGEEDFTRESDEYDVILDAVANRNFSACARRLAPRGVYITTLPTPINLVWTALSSLGLSGRKRSFIARVQPVGSDLAYLAGLASDGQVRPILDRVLPLDQAAAAFAESRAGHVRGKLVLSVAG